MHVFYIIVMYQVMYYFQLTLKNTRNHWKSKSRTSGDSSGTLPIQLSDKMLQSHLALLFFSKYKCIIALTVAKVYQAIEAGIVTVRSMQSSLS